MFRSTFYALTLSALVAGAAGLVTPCVASAQQLKVGVINIQRAILETAEIKKASDEMQARYKPRQDALEKTQRDLADIQAQLQAGQGKLSASAAAELEATGARKQREGQRLTEDLQADVERERNEILQRAGDRMAEVVKKLSEEKGLDMVIDASNMLYFKPVLELTTDAIAAYDKAYPIK